MKSGLELRNERNSWLTREQTQVGTSPSRDERAAKEAVNDAPAEPDLLFFGAANGPDHIANLHPKPRHMIKLWQIYVENVDPLLKVTNTPRLQGQVVDAIGNLESLQPSFEALLFAIYCIALLSLSPEDCYSAFGSVKRDLLRQYQSGCRHALSKCGILQTRNRESLTALFLYLVSPSSPEEKYSS